MRNKQLRQRGLRDHHVNPLRGRIAYGRACFVNVGNNSVAAWAMLRDLL